MFRFSSGLHTIKGGLLTFHRVTLEDNGMYQCVAKNKFGFAYQTVSMEVQGKDNSNSVIFNSLIVIYIYIYFFFLFGHCL